MHLRQNGSVIFEQREVTLLLLLFIPAVNFKCVLTEKLLKRCMKYTCIYSINSSIKTVNMGWVLHSEERVLFLGVMIMCKNMFILFDNNSLFFVSSEQNIPLSVQQRQRFRLDYCPG